MTGIFQANKAGDALDSEKLPAPLDERIPEGKG
jgi:hypothetical protein